MATEISSKIKLNFQGEKYDYFTYVNIKYASSPPKMAIVDTIKLRAVNFQVGTDPKIIEELVGVMRLKHGCEVVFNRQPVRFTNAEFRELVREAGEKLKAAIFYATNKPVVVIGTPAYFEELVALTKGKKGAPPAPCLINLPLVQTLYIRNTPLVNIINKTGDHARERVENIRINDSKLQVNSTRVEYTVDIKLDF